MFIPSDIDECLNAENNCHENAACKNTVGGFTCTCNNGYIGDGVNCKGITFIRLDSICTLLIQKIQVDKLHNCYLPLISNDESETPIFFPKKSLFVSCNFKM